MELVPACVEDALAAAHEVCLKKGARLTPLRERVLELVWRSHKPVGAYELLDSIKHEHKSAAPPTIYRALDFLMEHGLIHRIKSLNAYIGCIAPGHDHNIIFLICNECGSALEFQNNSVSGKINAFAADLGFELTSQSVEAAGLCPGCKL